MIVLCLLVVSVGLVAVVVDADDEPGAVAVISGSDRFFSFGLQDWVSFADAVVTVEVMSEERVPPPPEEERRGEGYVSRHVILVTRSTLWARPGGHSAPEQFEIATAGWVRRGGIEVPTTTSGAPRLERGGTYTMPILYLGDEGWSPLSPRSVMIVDTQGELVPGDADDRTDAVEALAGRSVDDIGELLRPVAPHPELAGLDARADPIARMTAVYGEFN